MTSVPSSPARPVARRRRPQLAAITVLLLGLLAGLGGCASSPSSGPESTCDDFTRAVVDYSNRLGAPVQKATTVELNQVDGPGQGFNTLRNYPALTCLRAFQSPTGQRITLTAILAAPGPGQVTCSDSAEFAAVDLNFLSPADVDQLQRTTGTGLRECSDSDKRNVVYGDNGGWEAAVNGGELDNPDALSTSSRQQGALITWLNRISFNGTF